MTDTQMRSYFDLLQDKSSEPYFLDSEKDEFLNAAQDSIINEYLDPADLEQPVLAEMDERAVKVLQPLIKRTTVADTQGIITFADVDGGTGATVRSIIGLESYAGETYVSFRKHLNWGAVEGNVYTQGNDGAGQFNYTLTADGILVSPVGRSDWVVTYIEEPTTYTALPNFMHRSVVAKALMLAGVPTESEALAVVEEITT